MFVQHKLELKTVLARNVDSLCYFKDSSSSEGKEYIFNINNVLLVSYYVGVLSKVLNK